MTVWAGEEGTVTSAAAIRYVSLNYDAAAKLELVRQMTPRITESLRLEGTSGDRIVQPPSTSRDSYRSPRNMPSQVLSTSTDRGSTISLGDLFQRLTILTVKKFSCVQTELYHIKLIKSDTVRKYLNTKALTEKRCRHLALHQTWRFHA